MTADLAGSKHPADADAPRGRDWRPWIGVLTSAGLLAAVVMQLGHASREALHMLATLPPLAWAAFALLYLVQPTVDFAIFKRLWKLPNSGIVTLLRKIVLNEVVFGYSGEAYFYLWAKRRAELTHAPFAAIKDVNLVSGLLGGLWTIVMLLAAFLSNHELDLVKLFGPALWAGAPLVAVSMAVVAFAAKVFSLSRPALIFVGRAHVARLGATAALTLLVWSLAIPAVPLAEWIVLLAVRLLIVRIPFLANKDLVFSNVILLVVGAGSPVALLLTSLAIATLAAHLAVIAVIGATDLARAAFSRNNRQI